MIIKATWTGRIPIVAGEMASGGRFAVRACEETGSAEVACDLHMPLPLASAHSGDDELDVSFRLLFELIAFLFEQFYVAIPVLLKGEEGVE